MKSETVLALEAKILEESNKYYYGDKSISDEEYDELVLQLKKLNPKSNVLKRVGFDISISPLKKFRHGMHMGSLNKVVNEDEYTDWLRGNGVTDDTLVVVQPKYDGMSVELIYENGILKKALSRGDGSTGEDITHSISLSKNVKVNLKTKFTGSIRAEAVIENSVFNNESFKKYANPRSAVAGIARKKHVSELAKHILLVPIDMWSDDEVEISEHEKTQYMTCTLGLKTADTFCVTAKKSYAMFKRIENKRNGSNVDIDGVVIKINTPDNKEIKNNRPVMQIAWKFDPEIAESVVESVSWEVGRTGKIIPVAKVKSVKMGGVNITKVSLHSFKNVVGLGLCIGDTVSISRRNDVIPYIEGVVSIGKTQKAVELDICPSCHHKVEVIGANYYCKQKGCEDKVVRTVVHWLEKLDVKGIGEKTIRVLYKNKVLNDITGLYRLASKSQSILSLPGFTKKKLDGIIKLIDSTKCMTPEKMLSSYGIDGLGSSKVDLIFSKLDIKSTLFDGVKTEFKLSIEGIVGMGHVSALIVSNSLYENQKELCELWKLVVDEKQSNDGVLTGKSFCFTGSIGIKRQDATKLVEGNGGMVKTSVSKGLTYLVQANPSSQSGKTKKAEKYGTKVIGEDQFFKMINFKFEDL